MGPSSRNVLEREVAIEWLHQNGSITTRTNTNTMEKYTNEQRYMALRKISMWLENDNDKAEAATAMLPDEEVAVNTDAEFDKIADAVCAAVEQIDPTVFTAEGVA